MKRYSILNNLDKCFFCGKPTEHIHEVYYGYANRKISIKNGFCVGLCHNHHNGAEGVHFHHDMDLQLKRVYQKEFEKHHTRQEFLKLVGKSYL